MKIKRKPKKAYYAKEKDGESSTIVFAENASEAKQLFNITDCGEDAEYIYGIDREKFDAWDEIIDELDTIIAVDAGPVVRCIRKWPIHFGNIFTHCDLRIYGERRTDHEID